jgi:hypothetical protein
MQAEKIGEALGLGASKYGALEEARGLLEGGAQSPADLALGMAKLSMAAPGLERSLGEIYKQMLAQTGSQQTAENLPGGRTASIPAPGMKREFYTTGDESAQNEISPKGTIPQSTDVAANATDKNRNISQSNPIIPPNGKYSAEDIDQMSKEYLLDIRPDLISGSTTFGKIPTISDSLQSDLRPEQEKQIRQDLTSKRVIPQVQEKIIGRIRENYKNLYNEAKDRYNWDENYFKNLKEKMSIVRKDADKNLLPVLGKFQPTFGFGGMPKTYNDLRNKYFEYINNLSPDLTPEQMNTRAVTRLQEDVKRIDEFEQLPSMPFIRDPKDVLKYIEDKKESMKELVKEGFYETVREQAAAKDMGIEELHWSLYGDETDKNSLRNLSMIPAAKLYSEGNERGAVLDIGTNTVNKNYFKERPKYIDKLSSSLTKIKPTDDLILLRAQVLNNGGTERDFVESLEVAQKKGLNLSEFQRSQLQEINIPRQRPIWEIFNPAAWRKMLKYQWGKR